MNLPETLTRSAPNLIRFFVVAYPQGLYFAMMDPTNSNDLKLKAARRALEFLHDDMVLGLGSGSTTRQFIDLLGEALVSGALHNVTGVPTSIATAVHAKALGIPLQSLSTVGELDLAVDGADEVDTDLNLIKGLGKALLREKIVEIHARNFVVMVDDSKLVKSLGSLGPLPVEIVPFESQVHIRWLQTLGCRAELWCNQSGEPFVTDNGNFLARCWFAPSIPDPHDLAERLDRRPGIVEHGLFLDLATHVIVSGKKGERVITRNKNR